MTSVNKRLFQITGILRFVVFRKQLENSKPKLLKPNNYPKVFFKVLKYKWIILQLLLQFYFSHPEYR